jgi:hypothetical protein
MKIKLNWPKILIWLTFITVFIYLIYPYSDYDWGWHFRYGEYFIKTGQILRDNLYTWTLASYKWANPSWLYDVFLYLSFVTFGFLGLSIIGAVLGLIIFIIPTIKAKLSYLMLGGTALFFIKLTQNALSESVRGQSFSLIFFCLLIFILIKAVKKSKTLYFIPPLILAWANLNGTFSLGILILGIFVGSNIVIRIINRYRHKTNEDLVDLKKLVIIFFLSVLASLINPFTYKVYYEGLVHITNPWVSYVNEWMPIYNCQNCHIGFFLVFQAILIIIFTARNKLTDLPYIITLLFLTVEAYLHRRYESMLIAASLPFVAMTLSNLTFDFEKYKLTKILSTLALIILIWIGLFVRMPKFNLLNYSFSDYCYNGSECSPGLADFLIKNPPVGRGFNYYDWGGFLIGRGVKAKLFIDGRMQLWDENGDMPFADFMKIYYDQNADIFHSYNFDWVIVRNDSYLAKTLLKPNIFWGTWKLVYYDQQASYFVRIKI